MPMPNVAEVGGSEERPAYPSVFLLVCSRSDRDMDAEVWIFGTSSKFVEFDLADDYRWMANKECSVIVLVTSHTTPKIWPGPRGLKTSFPRSQLHHLIFESFVLRNAQCFLCLATLRSQVLSRCRHDHKQGRLLYIEPKYKEI
jgi:hypothetical protein